MKKLLLLITLMISDVWLHAAPLVLNAERIGQQQETIAAEITRNKRQRLALKVLALAGCSMVAYQAWSVSPGEHVVAAPVTLTPATELTHEELPSVVKEHGIALEALKANDNASWGSWLANHAKNVAATFAFGHLFSVAQGHFNNFFYTPSLGWYITSHTKFGPLAEQVKFSLEQVAQGSSAEQAYHIRSLESLCAQFVEQLEGIYGFIAYEVALMQTEDCAMSAQAAQLQQHMIVRTNRLLADFAPLFEAANQGNGNVTNGQAQGLRGILIFDQFMQEFKQMVGRFMLYEN